MAIVTCMSLLVRQLKALITIKTVLNQLEHEIPADLGVSFLQCSQMLSQTKLWTIQEIIPIIVLPNDAAAVLIHATEGIRHCIVELRDLSTESRECMLRNLPDITSQLKTAHDAIESGHAECQRAVYGR
ncbi:hypothetical protein AKG95_15575 [Janthinobacterium lividum]|uniref:Uncharacterized protein n=1 Tax=Janthinobacterium lividum TaxID=29581 RepID=A0A1S1U8V8_9BURK|nr:hypothetical protein AKG95_15575 [Janthinobacterium lividum]